MAHTGIVPVPQATSRISYGTVETTSRIIIVQGGYQVGYIRVYLNGAYLPPDQYTATDGSTIDFGIDLPAGTDWIVDEARTFVSADHFSKEQSDQRYSRLDGGNDYTAMPTVNGAPIVESGSNSDGSWTRWADGTQNCHRHYHYTLPAGSTDSMYRSLPLPIPFTSRDYVPILSGRAITGGSGYKIRENYIYQESGSSVAFRAIVTIYNSGDMDWQFSIFTSGRWK